MSNHTSAALATALRTIAKELETAGEFNHLASLARLALAEVTKSRLLDIQEDEVFESKKFGPGRYSAIVLYDDQNWDNPVYEIDDDMSYREMKKKIANEEDAKHVFLIEPAPDADSGDVRAWLS